MPEHVAEETARRVSGPTILAPPCRVALAVEAGTIATVAVVVAATVVFSLLQDLTLRVRQGAGGGAGS